MFKYKARIYLHHTDAAGRLFFANQFYLIHEAKEHFCESLGLPIQSLLHNSQVTFPLVHAESDYKAVLVTGDEIEIVCYIEKIGESSVSFAFDIYKGDQLAGTARAVNVSVDVLTQRKVPLPQSWKACFEKGRIPAA